MLHSEFKKAYNEKTSYDYYSVDHVDVNNGMSFIERAIGMLVYKMITDESYYKKCKEAFWKTDRNAKDDGEAREALRYDDFVIKFNKDKQGTDKIEYHECQYFASDAIIDATWIKDLIRDGDLIFINSREIARKSGKEREELVKEKFNKENKNA